MTRWQHESIKKLLDRCWQIRRVHLEAGDIGAGQLLDTEFEQLIDEASNAFGHFRIEEE